MADPGIGVGAGGMLASLFNPGLASSVAQHVTPNPNPLAQQGQQGAGTVDSLGNPTHPNLAQPAVTQPDPANAANVAKLATPPDSSAALDYMRYQRMGELSNSFNRSLQGIAAGFGTAQQQASKQAALRGGDGSVGGGLADLAGIQALQEKTIADNEHARFQASADIMAQQILGLKPGQGSWLAASGELPAVLATHFSQLGPTEAVKNWNAARDAIKAADPNVTPEELNQRVPPELLAMGAGGTLDEQQYLTERAKGLTKDDYETWKNKHVASGDVLKTQAKDSTEFKDQAIQDVDKINEKLTTSEGMVDRLLKDIPATMTALKTPDQLTSGQGIAIAKDLPIVGGLVKSFIAPTDATTALAADIRTLKSGLAASALTDVKNVRNRQEFDAIGRSLTAGLDAANSPEAVQRVLEETKRRFAVARINAKAAAGRELSPEEAPLANPDYLKPALDNGEKNPYFTGATVAKSSAPAEATPTVSKRRHYNEKGELVDQ